MMKPDDNPVFRDYYLLDTPDKMLGLLVVAKVDNMLYLLEDLAIDKESNDFKTYFQGDLRGDRNDTLDWFLTKNSLDFMDHLLEKDLILVDVESVNEIIDHPVDLNSKTVAIYKIPQEKVRELIFARVFLKGDSLEMISKLNHLNKQKQQLNDLKLINDLEDSQAYLLDTIFDND